MCEWSIIRTTIQSRGQASGTLHFETSAIAGGRTLHEFMDMTKRAVENVTFVNLRINGELMDAPAQS